MLPLVLARAEVSASVVIAAVGLASLIAVPLGLLAAWRRNSLFDFGVVGATSAPALDPELLARAHAAPLLRARSRLAAGGRLRLAAAEFRAWALVLVLPVATLAAVECGTLLRMARASAIEVLDLEYVAHARAKGVPEARVLFRHVLPNAFAPTLTVIGLVIGHLLGGIAVLETVFTLPGLGRLLVESIFARDYPVVQGCLLFAAAVFVLVNLLVDLCYPLFDPRVAAE